MSNDSALLSNKECQQNISNEILENNKFTNINVEAIVDNEEYKQRIIKEKQNAHNITESLTASPCEELKGGIMHNNYNKRCLNGNNINKLSNLYIVTLSVNVENDFIKNNRNVSIKKIIKQIAK